MSVVLFQLPSGLVTVRLFPEIAPRATDMVVRLVEAGYYTGMTWYEINERWVATGCPVGMGLGTVAWMLEPEIDPEVRHERGAVSLEPFGDDLVSCRICMLRAPVPEWDGRRTVVGWVVDGMGAVDRLRPSRTGATPRTLLARVVGYDEIATAARKGQPLRAAAEEDVR